MMPTQIYPQNPISVNKAAKKYGIPQTTLTYWVKTGRLKILQYPEKKGQALLVDEISVVLALMNYTPYWRDKRHVCPFCGQPFKKRLI